MKRAHEDNSATLYKEASDLCRQKQYINAIEKVTALLDIDLHHTEGKALYIKLHCAQGIIYFNDKNYAQAVQCFESAHHFAPSDSKVLSYYVRALTARSRQLTRSNEFTDAIDILIHAIKVGNDEKDARIQYNKTIHTYAKHLLDNGNIPAAIIQFRVIQNSTEFAKYSMHYLLEEKQIHIPQIFAFLTSLKVIKISRNSGCCMLSLSQAEHLHKVIRNSASINELQLNISIQAAAFSFLSENLNQLPISKLKMNLTLQHQNHLNTLCEALKKNSTIAEFTFHSPILLDIFRGQYKDLKTVLYRHSPIVLEREVLNKSLLANYKIASKDIIKNINDGKANLIFKQYTPLELYRTSTFAIDRDAEKIESLIEKKAKFACCKLLDWHVPQDVIQKIYNMIARPERFVLAYCYS